MKRIFVLLFCMNSMLAQTLDKVSLISKNKDTLWLADNQLGHTIGQVWDFSCDYKNPPKIIYVKDLSQLLATSRKKEKRSEKRK